PQVGQVNVITDIRSFDEAATKSDCFYMPYNAVPSASLTSVLNLDPFLSADAAYDKTDFVGNVLNAVQRDGKTWAMPLQIEPMILEYNNSALSKAGVSSISNNWTVDSFLDTLKALKPDASAQTPYVRQGDLSSGSDGTDLLMLIADFGGLP